MSTITLKKLNSVYGPHARSILRDHLEQLPRERKRGTVTSFKILKPLPPLADFIELRRKQFTSTVDGLLDDAFGAFEEMAGELQEWYENLPEQFQEAEKGCQLQEVQEVLEGLVRPEPGDGIGEIEVFYMPKEGIKSRPARCDDAASRLHAIVDVLNDYLGESENEPKEDGPDPDEVQAFIEELEQVAEEAENIEFPGMYS